MNGSLLCEDWEAALDRRRRLYFDPGRSRLFEGDICYDFSWFGSLGEARRWCELEGVEFIDNSLGRLPDAMHGAVLAARRAASPPFRELARFDEVRKTGHSQKSKDGTGGSANAPMGHAWMSSRRCNSPALLDFDSPFAAGKRTRASL
jgi:hypothetical protein